MSKSDEPNVVSDNVIAARAALLDFYGDNAVSFASQFVASIFGLITISALIQAISLHLTESNSDWSAKIIFLIPSLFLFLSLSYLARYIYGRFTNYASIASNLVTISNGTLEMAKVEQLYIFYPAEQYETSKEQIKQACNKCKSRLPEGTVLCTEKKDGKKGTGALVNFRVHLDVMYETQNKSLMKMLTKHQKVTNLLMYLFLFILAFVTYFPLIAWTLSQFGWIKF
jgi:hypothetical protein